MNENQPVHMNAPPKISEYSKRSRRIRRTLALALIVYLIGCPIFGSYFWRFKHRSTKYHADVAKACDFILNTYALGTNRVMDILPSDPSLPRVISNLRPERLAISSNRVWILVNESHINGLAIIWEPLWNPSDVNQTNTWVLSITNGEGADANVYVTNRVPVALAN